MSSSPVTEVSIVSSAGALLERVHRCTDERMWPPDTVRHVDSVLWSGLELDLLHYSRGYRLRLLARPELDHTGYFSFGIPDRRE